MTMPTPQCPWRMQVHHIHQETPDVWTLSLICHDRYSWRAGQYALVSINNDAGTLRAYTLSSTPGVSEYLTLTVRRIQDGVGSGWLTQQVKRGDYIWLSDALGGFTCDAVTNSPVLMLAAGCGVTPIMSMRRWLAKKRPEVDVQVLYSVRSPREVIFAREWRDYPVTLVVEHEASGEMVAGRLSTALLRSVPDIAHRTVFCCGPAPYMAWAESAVRALGVTEFYHEPFFTPPVVSSATGGMQFTRLSTASTFTAPAGSTLLQALESNNVPIAAACRAGVCGSCKTQVIAGEYSVSSTQTLTEQERADGYVLACSCQPLGDLLLA